MTKNKGGVKKIMKRGEIWFANLPVVGGSIQYGERPVVVVSNNVCNRFSSVITVVPLTSVHKKKNQPTHIHLERKELKESIVICEQIITISKKMIDRKICSIDNVDMERIEKGIKIQMGI